MTKKRNQRKSKTLLSFVLVSFILFQFSCTNDKEAQKKVNLPYIGHHDIVLQAAGDYKVGDTIYHTVPAWEYITQDSELLTSSDINDKVWIADFFFTYCPTICPPMTKAMREVNLELQEYNKDLVFLSFSIDPDRDTPERLKTYQERHEITAKNWYFLTGDEDETHDLGVHGFQIHAGADEDAPGGFAHSQNFVLIDKNQHIRGIYDGLDPDGRKQLIEDAKKLLHAR